MTPPTTTDTATLIDLAITGAHPTIRSAARTFLIAEQRRTAKALTETQSALTDAQATISDEMKSLRSIKKEMDREYASHQSITRQLRAELATLNRELETARSASAPRVRKVERDEHGRVTRVIDEPA